ncbi:MAG: hypothetical protein ACLSHU_04510 [Oscillospiraceae bacterium]
MDGNDIAQVYDALTAPIGDKPRAIILDTVKGRASGKWKRPWATTP